MTKFVIKMTTCPLGGDVFWAENVQNEADWAYLSKETATELGGVGTIVEADAAQAVAFGANTRVVEPDPEHIAADDGMQAAIGAAHVEAHEEDPKSSDLIVLGGQEQTPPTAYDALVLREGESARNVAAGEFDPEAEVQRTADAVRRVIQNPNFGTKAAYVVLTLDVDEGFGITGNMDPETIHKVADLLMMRASGLPPELVDAIASMAFNPEADHDELHGMLDAFDISGRERN